MLYPSINEIKKKADSRYTLVILAAKRARDIVDGMPALVSTDIKRPVSIAAKEINEDMIKVDYEPKQNEVVLEDVANFDAEGNDAAKAEAEAETDADAEEADVPNEADPSVEEEPEGVDDADAVDEADDADTVDEGDEPESGENTGENAESDNASEDELEGIPED